MKFKVAYTKNKNQIQPAINNHLIDSGDLVVVENQDKSGEMIFINETGEQIECGTKDYIDNKLYKLPNESITLEQSVSDSAIPGIYDFTLIPQTKYVCMNLIGDSRGFFDPTKKLFYGIEVPLVTTRGKIIVRNTEDLLEYEKNIPELINYYGISDIMTNEKITKRWSRRFYINRPPDSTESIDNGSNTTSNSNPNTIATWIFTEKDFEDIGFPAKLSDIPFISPIFCKGNESDVTSRFYEYGHPVRAYFTYDSANNNYILKCRMRSYNKKSFYEWTPSYICYQLESETYIYNDMLSLYLNKGYKVTFEQDDAFDIFWNYAITQQYCPLYNDSAKALWLRDSVADGINNNADPSYINVTPTMEILVPQSIVGSLESMEHIARELNKTENSGGSNEVNDYQWIGAGDGVTDYSDKIQKKIDEAYYNGGGQVYLGPGIYPISKEILIQEKVQLIGSGKGITIIKQTSNNTHAIGVVGWYIHISDLSIKLGGECTRLTGCIVAYDYTKQGDQVKTRYLSVENVEFSGTYKAIEVDGVLSKPDNYRGVGFLVQEKIGIHPEDIESTDNIEIAKGFGHYCNFSNFSITVNHLHAGVYGGGANNKFSIWATESEYAAWTFGGNNIYKIVGHSFYDRNNKTSASEYLRLSKCAVYSSDACSSFEVQYGDGQYIDCVIEFTPFSRNNSYIVSISTAYMTNGLQPWKDGMEPRTHIIDNGLGNSNAAPVETVPFSIGLRNREISGLTSPRLTLDGAKDNSLAGAGIWGSITSVDMWENKGIGLADICRYPDNKATLYHLPYILSNRQPTADNPIIIEIDISNRPIVGAPNLWIQFYHLHVAKRVKLYFDTNNDGIYDFNDEIFGNQNTVLWYLQHQLNDIIYRIKIEIIEALIIPEYTYNNGSDEKFIENYNPDGFVGICNIGCASNSPFGRAFLGECGGDLYGNINLNYNHISNLAEPTSDNDAVTKKYVDDLIATLSSQINTIITK